MTLCRRRNAVGAGMQSTRRRVIGEATRSIIHICPVIAAEIVIIYYYYHYYSCMNPPPHSPVLLVHILLVYLIYYLLTTRYSVIVGLPQN